MSLEVGIEVDRGRFRLALDLTVRPGEVVALLGPNGAGKSTALAAVAGLVPLSAGRTTLAGRVLEDVGAGVRVPVERRGCGVVFQDHLLFGHLTALENVAFGLRARGMAAAEARRRAAGWLDQLGLAELAEARVPTLSGGQAQRVALARALVGRPDALLLDEPFASLDAGSRLEVRAAVAERVRHFAGPVVLVTHDLVDAMVLADRVVVLEGGRVAQTGTPREVAHLPRSEYVARLAGTNLYRGTGRAGRVDLAAGGSIAVADPVAGDTLVVVPPTAVQVSAVAPPPGPNVWPGRVESVEHWGESVRVRLASLPPVTAEMSTARLAEHPLHLGEPAWAVVPPAATRTSPASPSSPAPVAQEPGVAPPPAR